VLEGTPSEIEAALRHGPPGEICRRARSRVINSEADRSQGVHLNPVQRFIEAINRGDIDGATAAFHPDFEMIVPQHPSRGFRGRDQEMKNMRHLTTTYPDGRLDVLRMVEASTEIWIESTFTAPDLQVAAVVIYEIDPESDTIRSGRYYSERVEEQGPGIDEWLEGLQEDPEPGRT
jgi:ketosteroid isomerase-like protein